MPISILLASLQNIIRVRDDLSVCNDHIESLFIELPSQKSLIKPLVIGVIYRPPNTNLDLFILELDLILNTLKTENKSTYVTGDFNINLLNSDTHTYTQNFLNCLHSYAYIPLITKPTRVTSETATLIDNIFYNDVDHPPILHGILYTDITDHFPVFAVLTPKETKCDAPHYTRNISPSSMNNFNLTLQQLPWNEVLDQEDCQTAYSNFHCIYLLMLMVMLFHYSPDAKHSRIKNMVERGIKKIHKN